MTDESRMNRAGCLVVVLVLASAFLHVKISVKGSQGIPWECH